MKNHPLLGCMGEPHTHKHHQLGMGDYWSDLRDKYLVDPATDLLSNIVGDEEAAAIVQDAVDSSKKDLNAELANLVNQSSGGSAQPAGPGVVAQIDSLNKSAVLSMIPGGLYTLMGITAAVGGYLIFTRR